MTKSKNGIVTSIIAYLATDTFPLVVTVNAITFLHLSRYLLSLTTLNGYLQRDNNGIFRFTTSSENIDPICCQTWGIPRSHPTFGLCHNSLNLVNLAKTI